VAVTTWDRERTALHEAGHAVVAWSFGVTVGCIHLDSEKQGGHAEIAPATHLEPFEQIAIALAGFESEQIFKPPGDKRGFLMICTARCRLSYAKSKSLKTNPGGS